MSSEVFYALLKKEPVICSQRVVLPIQSGATASFRKSGTFNASFSSRSLFSVNRRLFLQQATRRLQKGR
jgi:hypothetical protein